MNILFLGPDSPTYQYLCKHETVERLETPIVETQADFIVSHGYRHIIPESICKAYDGRAVNLHISYLPWNRGSDPNFWSFVDGTPKGVSIHYIAKGLDTGDLIGQELVELDDYHTLKTSYAKLQHSLFCLFTELWPSIRTGRCERTPQGLAGSYHRASEKTIMADLLTQGWDTPVKDLKCTMVGFHKGPGWTHRSYLKGKMHYEVGDML